MQVFKKKLRDLFSIFSELEVPKILGKPYYNFKYYIIPIPRYTHEIS